MSSELLNTRQIYSLANESVDSSLSSSADSTLWTVSEINNNSKLNSIVSASGTSNEYVVTANITVLPKGSTWQLAVEGVPTIVFHDYTITELSVDTIYWSVDINVDIISMVLTRISGSDDSVEVNGYINVEFSGASGTTVTTAAPLLVIAISDTVQNNSTCSYLSAAGSISGTTTVNDTPKVDVTIYASDCGDNFTYVPYYLRDLLINV